MTRTIVVGDVHGCAAELEALLDACSHRPNDRLVLVGDLVAKGPDSRGVVGRIRALGGQAVMGNHDHHVVAWWLARRSGRRPTRDLKPPHRQVVDTLDDDALDWLAALPHRLRLPEHQVIVVHAGLVPGVPLEQQRPEDLRNMRTLRPDGTPSSKLDDGVLWATRWPGPEHVLFGHDAVTGLQSHEHATGLDTGCVYGRRLTACVLPERELVSVPAARDYASDWT